jgi:hypothetical protein
MKEKGCVVPLPQGRSGSQPRVPPIRRRVSFFEFSLCLSRACLGKIMLFIYKWRKKTVFLPGQAHPRHARRPPSSARRTFSRARRFRAASLDLRPWRTRRPSRSDSFIGRRHTHTHARAHVEATHRKDVYMRCGETRSASDQAEEERTRRSGSQRREYASARRDTWRVYLFRHAAGLSI